MHNGLGSSHWFAGEFKSILDSSHNFSSQSTHLAISAAVPTSGSPPWGQGGQNYCADLVWCNSYLAYHWFPFFGVGHSHNSGVENLNLFSQKYFLKRLHGQ